MSEASSHHTQGIPQVRSVSFQQWRGVADQHAMTLTELLAVLAIIALLAALLLPLLTNAKRRAQSVQCINNERQLGLALGLYLDQSHSYPFDWRMPVYETLDPQWRKIGGPYFDRGVWRCPAANSDLREASYGYNKFGVLRVGNLTNGLGLFRSYTNPVREEEVAAPSDMMAVGDSLIPPGGFFRWDLNGVRPWANDLSRHGGRANVLFCDHHVESPTVRFLLDDTNDNGLVRWNRDHLPHRDQLHPRSVQSIPRAKKQIPINCFNINDSTSRIHF